MPFTPFHMGPGLLMKGLLQGSFSLLIFGWTQVVMDIQPLIVLITGEGHLHGFTHTFIGAALIAVFTGLSGKYLAVLALKWIDLAYIARLQISWTVALSSAFLGSFSHVLLDAVMHADVEPFFPFSLNNPWLQQISTAALHQLCLYSGLAGCIVYISVQAFQRRRKPG